MENIQTECGENPDKTKKLRIMIWLKRSDPVKQIVFYHRDFNRVVYFLESIKYVQEHHNEMIKQKPFI